MSRSKAHLASLFLFSSFMIPHQADAQRVKSQVVYAPDAPAYIQNIVKKQQEEEAERQRRIAKQRALEEQQRQEREWELKQQRIAADKAKPGPSGQSPVDPSKSLKTLMENAKGPGADSNQQGRYDLLGEERAEYLKNLPTVKDFLPGITDKEIKDLESRIEVEIIE